MQKFQLLYTDGGDEIFGSNVSNLKKLNLKYNILTEYYQIKYPHKYNNS